MAAARPPPLLVVLVLWLSAVAAAAPGADVNPLRALRSEEGSIDDLISRIEQLQHKKGQQLAAKLHVDTTATPGAHPERMFAYYPSDPEYRAPRRPSVISSSRDLGSGQGHGPSAGVATGARVSATTGSPPKAAASISTTSAPTGKPEAESDTGDQQSDRDKKSSSDTQVLKVHADSLLAPAPSRDNSSDVYFIVTVAGICVMAVCVTVGGGFCYHRLQKRAKAAGAAEYPAYGVTGPSRDLSPSGDRKLAQSAQMYHYQHQKQQMMAMEKTHNGRHGSASDVDSEEENEEGDYTVYECPGLAPTGEMEVKNPLFQDDQTPAPAATADSNGQ